MITHVSTGGSADLTPIEQYLAQHRDDFGLALGWIDRGNTPTPGAPESTEPLAQLTVVQDSETVTLRLTQIIAALNPDQLDILRQPLAA